MTLRPTPNAGPSLMWTTFATVSVPTFSHDSSGAPTQSYTDTTNVPCDIQPGGTSEALKYGAGHAHESSRLFQGFFPVLDADGTALSIPSGSKVTADSVTYYAAGAGSEYADGVQVVPLEIRA